MRYQDENIWLTQKMMAELYGVTVPAIIPDQENSNRHAMCDAGHWLCHKCVLHVLS